MTIYYKTITVLCEYPFNDEVDYRYCEFYTKTKSKGSKRYQKIDDLVFESATTLKDKIKYLETMLEQKDIELIKLKF